MYSSVIDHNVVHFDVGFLARINVVELNEAILQGLPGFPVSNHFHAFDEAEAGKYDLQILLLGDGIEFADEEDVFRRL